MEIHVFTDSSAARGVANRLGLGKLRHLDVRLLWVQEMVRSGRVQLRKVRGDVNPADMLTKPKSAKDLHIQLEWVDVAIAG